MASAFEHKSLRWLRERFEQGDVPTGYDFARLIDSCHNSLANTDMMITGSLTVSGDITCLGSVNGTQQVTTNDPRVDQLLTIVSTNSAKWNQVTPIESLHRQSLEYLYSKFEAGDTPTEQDFKVLIDSSHNTYAHENTFISDTITTVQTNSAAWFGGGGGGGGGIDYDLRTTVSTKQRCW